MPVTYQQGLEKAYKNEAPLSDEREDARMRVVRREETDWHQMCPDGLSSTFNLETRRRRTWGSHGTQHCKLCVWAWRVNYLGMFRH
jgi:hypothetical protein